MISISTQRYWLISLSWKWPQLLTTWPQWLGFELYFYLTNMEATTVLYFLGRQPDVSKLSYSELCTVQRLCEYVNHCCQRINYRDLSAEMQLFVVLIICISYFSSINVHVGPNLSYSVLRKRAISFPTNGNNLLTWWVFSALASSILIWFQQEHVFCVPGCRYIDWLVQERHNSIAN